MNVVPSVEEKKSLKKTHTLIINHWLLAANEEKTVSIGGLKGHMEIHKNITYCKKRTILLFLHKRTSRTKELHSHWESIDEITRNWYADIANHILTYVNTSLRIDSCTYT